MDYMKRARELAEKGRGYTSPNPVVGAVIVKDGRIIGEGYHERYGELHAERNALAACREDPAGAEMYVTLEPCCHYGKTPPCTEAIIGNGISRVYVGSADPNPLVAGRGIEILRQAGIEVIEDVDRKECDLLNRVFFHYIGTGRPYVTLKYAMTADGKIATKSGRSKWITGEEARRYVHRLRHENAVIMTGIGTVAADDPLLNCRLDGGLDPVRVICDTRMRIPLDSQIVRTAGSIRTIIAAADDEGGATAETKGRLLSSSAGTVGPQSEKEKALLAAGCEILKVGQKNGHVDMQGVMDWLGENAMDSVLLECGGGMAWSALSGGMVDRIMAFTAPKIFGGETAGSPVGGFGYDGPQDGPEMKIRDLKRFGEDIMIEYEVRKCSRE